MADSIYEVDKVIGRRRTLSGKEEYLVHWKNYKPLYSTWEPVENLATCLHTVTEFMAKAFPMPGMNATSIDHLENRRQLKKVTDIDRRKLKGVANKEMVKEILKVNTMKKELNKYHRGRGRKRCHLNSTSAICGEDTKKFRTSPKNGQCFEKTLHPDLACHSPNNCYSPDKPLGPIRSTVKKRGRRANRGASQSLIQQDSGDDALVSLSTRPTRTNGVVDEFVSVRKEERVWKISLCSEKKQNALTTEMCDQLANILHEASKDEQLVVVVITGAGENFCSGLDYSGLVRTHNRLDAKNMVEKFKLLVELLITFPKVLVAGVNGNVRGFGTALLALCDIVYSGSTASFQTCFTKWGHPPIGCSSFLLSHLLGQTEAMSMLLLNRKMASTEAWENGLVIEVLNSSNFTEQLSSRVQAMASLPNKVLQDTKSLIKQADQETLREINDKECKLLLRYLADDQVLDTLKKTWLPEVVEV